MLDVVVHALLRSCYGQLPAAACPLTLMSGDGLPGSDSPTSLTAMMRNEYSSPSVRPGTVMELSGCRESLHGVQSLLPLGCFWMK